MQLSFKIQQEIYRQLFLKFYLSEIKEMLILGYIIHHDAYHFMTLSMFTHCHILVYRVMLHSYLRFYGGHKLGLKNWLNRKAGIL